MKIYFIDIYGKNLRIKKLIEKKGLENIEHKDSYSFRSTKNDYNILSEYNEKNLDNQQLSKLNNLIVITDKKDEDTILKLANEYKTIDIISSDCGEEYIAERIYKLIS